MRRSQPCEEAGGYSLKWGEQHVQRPQCRKGDLECGWSTVWEGEAGGGPHESIIGLMKNVYVMLRSLEFMEGFPAEH